MWMFNTFVLGVSDLGNIDPSISFIHVSLVHCPLVWGSEYLYLLPKYVIHLSHVIYVLSHFTGPIIWYIPCWYYSTHELICLFHQGEGTWWWNHTSFQLCFWTETSGYARRWSCQILCRKPDNKASSFTLLILELVSLVMLNASNDATDLCNEVTVSTRTYFNCQLFDNFWVLTDAFKVTQFDFLVILSMISIVYQHHLHFFFMFIPVHTFSKEKYTR